MLTRSISLIGIIFCAALLQGCWEQEGVVMHEPGQYKGAVDTLVTDTSALQARFTQVQTDR